LGGEEKSGEKETTDMRKIRVFAHISLDGVIAPEGPKLNNDYSNGGWMAAYRSPGGAEMLADVQGKGYDLLLGRRTYDLWSGYWPTVKTGPFAEGINGATKYVATHRPDSLSWGPVEALGDDVVEGIRRVKSQDGADLILWGSSTVASKILEQRLAEEVVLITYPIFLGRGKRLFSEEVDPRDFSLVSSKSTATGVLLNTYHPKAV
jgi:dihydrofolate reductase